MSLDHIVPNASLERGHYHQLATRELDQLDDAEALFERAFRLVIGIGATRNREAAGKLIMESAKLGHPVALALCLEQAGTAKNIKRAIELHRASAERGHVSGSLHLLVCFSTTKPKLNSIWECATRAEEALRRTNEKLFVGIALLPIRIMQ